jgi:hypothetical protein
VREVSDAAQRATLVPAYVERGEERRVLSSGVRLIDRFFRGTRIKLVNLSSGGFSADGAGMLKRGDVVWINLPGIGPIRSQVRWRLEDRFGAAFLAVDDLRLRFINGLPG